MNRRSTLFHREWLRFEIEIEEKKWSCMRRQQTWESLLHQLDISSVSELEALSNKHGPTLDMLYFIDYFKHNDLLPEEYVQSMLSQTVYTVTEVALKQTKIEITDIGESS